MLAYNINENTITVITSEGPLQLPRRGDRGAQLIMALNAGETDVRKLRELADPTTYIQVASGQRIALRGSVVRIDGEEIPAVLARKLAALVEDGVPVDYLVKFWDKLKRNTSHNSVEQLFKFLEHGGFPILPSGNVLGYKSIREDWTDHYSSKFSNKIGNVLRMRRNKVCDDPSQGCSYGFHIGSENYAQTFGGGDKRMIIVEFNPAHVVSVPHDCSYQKLRVCEYRVVSEYKGRLVDSGVAQADDPYTRVFTPDELDGSFAADGYDAEIEVITAD